MSAPAAKEEKSALGKAWGGALTFLGIFGIIILALYLLGPLLGMGNNGIRGINAEFQNTPGLITFFGVNLGLTMAALMTLIIKALLLSLIIWLAIEIFMSIVSKKKGGDEHAHPPAAH